MEDKFCPQCGAPMSGKSCDFCGYKATDNAAAAAPEEQRIATATKRPDYLYDKADFLDADGQLKLGLMYLNGVGVEKSEALAAELFRKAADGGSREGMFRYAEALANGAGVECDEDKAKALYVEAARMGHPGARVKLKEFSDYELEIVPEKQAASGFEGVVGRVRPFCVEFTCFSGGVPVSQGSGCVIFEDLVLTNSHVVFDLSKGTAGMYDTIYVNFDKKYDSRNYEVKVIAADIKEDIALCGFVSSKPSMPQDGPKLVSALDVGPGKEIFTVGNGLGRGLGVSRGVISRDIERNAYGHKAVIRTDMSVNPGNSGGALFNLDGNIIGIMTFVAKQGDGNLAYGMSYAVISDSVMEMLEKLMQ